jgi:hypothetical protein
MPVPAVGTRMIRLVSVAMSYLPLLCVTLVVTPFVLTAPFLPARYWERLHALIRELRGWNRDILDRSVQAGCE